MPHEKQRATFQQAARFYCFPQVPEVPFNWSLKNIRETFHDFHMA